MLIAPAYEPMSHVAFGIINHTTNVRSGVYDLLRAYAALVCGAAAFVGLAYLWGVDPLASSADTYMSSDCWSRTGRRPPGPACWSVRPAVSRAAC